MDMKGYFFEKEGYFYNISNISQQRFSLQFYRKKLCNPAGKKVYLYAHAVSYRPVHFIKVWCETPSSCAAPRAEISPRRHLAYTV